MDSYQSQEGPPPLSRGGLQLTPRGAAATGCPPCAAEALVGAPNERWAMDFMHDVLATGSTCGLHPGGCLSRECVALAVAKSFQRADVATNGYSDAGRAGGRTPTDHPVRQRDRVHLDGAGSLGILEPACSCDFRPGPANPSTTASARPSTAHSDVSASRVGHADTQMGRQGVRAL